MRKACPACRRNSRPTPGGASPPRPRKSSRLPAVPRAGAGRRLRVLVAGAILAPSRQAIPHGLWLAGAAALSLVILARPIARRGLLRRSGLAVALIATAALLMPCVDRALAAWEERAPRFGAASAVASSALGLVGYRTSVVQGDLLIDHPDGLVTVVPSMEKLALRPFLLLWAAWLALRLIRDGRRSAGSAVVGLAVVLLAVMARYVALMAAYIEHDTILAGAAGSAALDLFGSPWITGIILLAAGFALDRAGGALVRSVASPSPPPPHRIRSAAVAGAAMAGLGAAAGLAWTFVPPGPEKAGRVLIDDRFCGIWEPTARQLDPQWYGDFPTYSFTSLAEWLGRWFSVDANTTRPYDDSLLSQYDVLVIKTPEEPIPDAEVAAIERFVRDGGGLLLVGDHTNLLGMGTHLNALSARYGIRFRYDSVSDGATGGFVRCDGAPIGRPVGALHVDHLEFMTSCSLQLSGDAETVLAAEGCRREPHDYAGSSFFGRRGPHPELEHGRTVLAATARVGRGRIAAFTDSTVWSSFAVFQWDREKLAMDLVRMLNRTPSPFEMPLRVVAIAAGILALLAGVGLARSGLALPAILGGLLGLWSGAAISDGLHRSIYAWPEPNAPIDEVTFLWQGGACAFPPVLGSAGSLPADRSFDTLLVSVQRLGLVPRVAYTYDEMIRPETRAVFAVAPVNTPPRPTLDRLKEFVRGGGCLVILDDWQIGDRGSGKDFLGLFDVPITYHGPQSQDGKDRPHVHIGGGMVPIKAPAADAFVAQKSFGRGQVVYMSDAAYFSREGLGHCFSRPSKAARARYETIYALFRDLLRIAPTDRRFYGIL